MSFLYITPSAFPRQESVPPSDTDDSIRPALPWIGALGSGTSESANQAFFRRSARRITSQAAAITPTANNARVT